MWSNCGFSWRTSGWWTVCPNGSRATQRLFGFAAGRWLGKAMNRLQETWVCWSLLFFPKFKPSLYRDFCFLIAALSKSKRGMGRSCRKPKTIKNLYCECKRTTDKFVATKITIKALCHFRCIVLMCLRYMPCICWLQNNHPSLAATHLVIENNTFKRKQHQELPS